MTPDEQARIDNLEWEIKELKKSFHNLRNQVMALLLNQENDGK